MADSLTHRTTKMERCESPYDSFLQLPAELRNRIYELAFEDGRDTIDVAETFLPSGHRAVMTIDATRRELVNAALPSSALMRCCQQIHDESKGIFTAACRRYWKKTFTITLDNMLPFSYFVAYVPLYMMDTIEVTARTPTRMLAKACLVRPNGGGRPRAVKMESVDRGRDPKRWEKCDVKNTGDLLWQLKWFLVDYTKRGQS